MLFEVASHLPDEVPPELDEAFLIILYQVKNDIDALLDELHRAIQTQARQDWDFYQNFNNSLFMFEVKQF